MHAEGKFVSDRTPGWEVGRRTHGGGRGLLGAGAFGHVVERSEDQRFRAESRSRTVT